MARQSIYLQPDNTVIVDGVQLAGFAEGDWVEIAPEGNAAQRSLGGDGPSMNISTDQGGRISISLMPNSPNIGKLYEIREAQQKNPRLFSITVLTGCNEQIRGDGCAFGVTDPIVSGGDKMAARKFNFESLRIKLDTSSTEGVDGSYVRGII